MIARYAALVLAMQLAICIPTTAQSHLEPERGILNQPEWEWSYAKRLREVLLRDAGSYHLAARGLPPFV